MTITVEDAGKGYVSSRCDDGLIKDLPAGEVRIQVDVGGQDEMLIVIFGSLAKHHQVFCCSYLVRVVWLSCAAAVLCLGGEADKANHNQ